MKPVGLLDDNIGIGISWLSIAHCLAIPGFRLLIPDVAAHWSHSAQTHILLAAFVIFFGIAAITQEELQHRNLSVRLKMVPGIMIVMAASIGVLLLGPMSLEIVALTLGNLLVILAHQQNKKLIYAYNALAHVASESTLEQNDSTFEQSEQHQI